MGVAWHRFLAVVNVYARRDPRGGVALGPLQPMTDQRCAGRPRRAGGPSRRRPPRGRRHRGLHVEGPARLLHVHRVRPLPGPVPGVGDGQAAEPQARHAGAAGPRGGDGARTCGRRRVGRTVPTAGRPPSTTRASTCSGPASSTPTPSGPAPVRRVRAAVPRGHRARGRDRRHAALPGAHGVGVPQGAGRHVHQAGAAGQPVGAAGAQPARLGEGAGLRRAGGRGRRGVGRRGRVPVLGRLRGRLRGPRDPHDEGRRGAAAHRRRQLRGAGRRRVLHR